MELLAILVVLGFLQLWGSGKPVQKDQWYSHVVDLFSGAISGNELRVILSVLTPVLILLVVQQAVDGMLLGFMSLFLYVVVLLYCLGRGDFSELIQMYLAKWNHGNFESAYFAAKKIGDFSRYDEVETREDLHPQVRQAVFY